MANKTPKHQYLYLKAEAGNDRQIKGEGVIHLALGTKRGPSCQGLTRQEMHGGATDRYRRIIRKMTTTGNRFPEQTRARICREWVIFSGGGPGGVRWVGWVGLLAGPGVKRREAAGVRGDPTHAWYGPNTL